MNNGKIPRFYINKTGEYGDVRVSSMVRRHRSGTDLSMYDIFYKENPLVHADFSESTLTLNVKSASDEEIFVINESLRQMDHFRSIVVIHNDFHFPSGEHTPWALIVDGQKVPLISDIELHILDGSIYMAIPWKPIRKEMDKELDAMDSFFKKKGFGKPKKMSMAYEYQIRAEAPRRRR
jgi:hypothetical protein